MVGIVSGDIVQAHIDRWMSLPFEWGKTDCLLVLADYLLDVTGRDCAAHFRGKYNSAKTCHKLTGFLSDPVAVFYSGVDQIGLKETSRLKRGDVGLIEVAGQIVGGIYLGNHWASKSPAGVAIGLPQKIIKSWKVS